MSTAFDDRLMTFTITSQGQTFTFDQQYYMLATGARFINGNCGECSIRIDNISKQTRDYLATNTTTWRKGHQVAEISLEVGRVSYGTFQLFQGNAIVCTPTQPPDIGLIIKSLANSAAQGFTGSLVTSAQTSFSGVCQQVAQQNNLTLSFQANNNPQIGNYHFNGSIPKQIDKLNSLGLGYLYIDGNTLIVTDINTARKLPNVQININTGMIGIPEVTAVGCRVKVLISNDIRVGTPVTITSTSNSAANGNYYVYKIMFEVASREVPFYWILELRPESTSFQG